MLSKTCKYAIRATLYLAVNTNETARLGVKDLAEALMVPKHFLAKILQVLTKNEVISSAKGPGGGFFMKAENLGMSVMDVVVGLEKKEIFVGCVLGLPVCSHENPCPLHKSLVHLRDGFYYQLESQTIGEIAHAMKYHGYQI
jgi:Rrf2 family protein